MTVDDREDVIEVVAHPTRELADGFHVLRLTQLFLQSFLRRDITEELEEHQRLAPQLHKGAGVLEHDYVAAAQGRAPFALVVDYPVAEAVGELLQHPARLLGFGEDDGEGLAFKRLSACANQVAEGVVDRDPSNGGAGA